MNKETRDERRGQESEKETDMGMITHVILWGQQMTVQAGDSDTVCELSEVRIRRADIG
jgi:hypothetical protein